MKLHWFSNGKSIFPQQRPLLIVRTPGKTMIENDCDRKIIRKCEGPNFEE
jgi:hypothetical protein